jgi:hypothetical protein
MVRYGDMKKRDFFGIQGFILVLIRQIYLDFNGEVIIYEET